MSTEIARGSVGLQIDRGLFEKDVLGATSGAAEKAGAAFSSKFSGLIGKLGSAGTNLGLPFTGALTQMSAKMDETGSHATGLKAALGGAAIPTVALAVAVAAVGVEALKLGAEMQAADASIAAHAGISTAAAKKIGDAFLDTAGKSTFSGQEMAKAFAPVAGQLGLVEGHALSAAQATQVMKAAADLAEASGGALAETTASLAAVMQAYGINAAGAADASNTLWNVSKLTGNQVGTVATVVDRLHKSLGLLVPSLSDTGALMVELAEHGATGSRGTQVLATGLNTLLGGSKATSDELKLLGINLFDSSGKFVGMGSVIAQLGPKLSGMTEQQRLLAEKTLFGASAGQLLSQVMIAGVPAFSAATAAVSKHGAVQEAARLQSATFEGQIKTLKATAIDLGTKLGVLLIPFVIKVGQEIAKVTQFFIAHKAVAIALGLVLADILTGGISTVIAAIVVLSKNWNTIWTDMKRWTLDGVRKIVDAFLDMAGWIIKGAAAAFGWVPGIGGKLKEAAKHFDDFKTSVDAALGDTNAQLKLASQQMDTFNQKAAATGSSIRQVSASTTGSAEFVSGVGKSTGVVKRFGIGGVVTQPTFAQIGESGAEAVVPLTNPAAAARVWAAASLAGYSASIAPPSTGGSGSIVIENLNVTNPNPPQLATDLARGLRSQQFLLGVD